MLASTTKSTIKHTVLLCKPFPMPLQLLMTLSASIAFKSAIFTQIALIPGTDRRLHPDSMLRQHAHAAVHRFRVQAPPAIITDSDSDSLDSDSETPS
eukprot:872845-Rhodomonas_salina.1